MKHSDYVAKIENDPLYLEGQKALKTKFALGDAILRARIERNWSQKELAKRVGTKQANISRIESANANPTLDLIHRLLEVLEINIFFAASKASAIGANVQTYCDFDGIQVDWPSKANATQIKEPVEYF